MLRPASPTDLADQLRVPPTSISRHVARLADAGLVQRVPNGHAARPRVRRGGRVGLGRYEPGLAGFRGRRHIFVPNGRDNTVSRIDPATNAVIETIRVSAGPAVFKRAFGDLWLTHLRSKQVWRLRVG